MQRPGGAREQLVLEGPAGSEAGEGEVPVGMYMASRASLAKGAVPQSDGNIGGISVGERVAGAGFPLFGLVLLSKAPREEGQNPHGAVSGLGYLLGQSLLNLFSLRT